MPNTIFILDITPLFLKYPFIHVKFHSAAIVDGSAVIKDSFIGFSNSEADLLLFTIIIQNFILKIIFC